ncbi:MAG: Uma2 family endonuclease [Chloroflexi bacterium]|nr:Uma2 family endonuclease [Chloroflexota bacterium]
MTTTRAPRLMTADEWLMLPNDGNRYELSQGVLITMCPQAYDSGFVGGKALVRLGNFVEQGALGEFGISDVGFRLTPDPDTVRAPDVWFVRAERVPKGMRRRRYFEGVPDLAIEVLSPTDRYPDVMKKVQEYMDAGTPLLWVIDPERRNAVVHRPGQNAVFLDEHAGLDGEDVLPGFTLPLIAILPPVDDE